MASQHLFDNNAFTTVNAQLLTGGTSLTVAAGSVFTAPTGTQYNLVTLVRASDNAIEIVSITGIATNVLTITRAQEGTSALQFEVGDIVEARLTAGTLDDFANGTIGDSSAKAVKVGHSTSTSSEGAALGHAASAAYKGVSVGYSTSGASKTVSIGHDAYSGTNGVAIGYSATSSTYSNGVAVGSEAVGASSAVALGNRAGYTNVATGAVMVGSWANSSGTYGVAIGRQADVSGGDGVALGRSTDAAAQGFAVGYSANALANSIALGAGSYSKSANTIQTQGVQTFKLAALGTHAGTEIKNLAGVEAIIQTATLNLKNTQTVTIALPVGNFYPTEVGVIHSSVSTVTGAMSFSAGETSSTAKYLAITATTQPSANTIERFTTLASADAATDTNDFVFDVTTGATATTLEGRFYVKGIHVTV